MARHKKDFKLKVEEKEVPMTDEKELESVNNEIDLARVELERTKLEIEEKKHQLNLMKVTPSREISEDEKKLVDKQVSMTSEKQTLKEKIERQKKYDNVMVTGRFTNRRAPGQPAKLTYLKHEGDPVKWYTLEDGKIYTIPRGFADQINGGTDEDPCYYTPKFNKKQGEMNPDMPESAIHSIDSSNKKYMFSPTNF